MSSSLKDELRAAARRAGKADKRGCPSCREKMLHRMKEGGAVSPADEMFRGKTSIIINTSNEGPRLRATVEDFRCNLAGSEHEFIIVADNVTDDTVDGLDTCITGSRRTPATDEVFEYRWERRCSDGPNVAQDHDEMRDAFSRVYAQPPRVFVELGAMWGGSAYVYAGAMQQGGHIILVDTEVSAALAKTADDLRAEGFTVDVIEGRSSDVVGEVSKSLNGRSIDLLHVDDDHSYEGVIGNVEAYVPLVGHGGLAFFHDICQHTEPDVARAWESIKADYIHDEIRGNMGIGVTYLKPPEVHIVRTDTFVGCAQAKRLGAAEATGDVLGFYDAHHGVRMGKLAGLSAAAMQTQGIVYPALGTMSYSEDWEIQHGDSLHIANDADVEYPWQGGNQYTRMGLTASVMRKYLIPKRMVGVGVTIPREVYDRMGGWNHYGDRHGAQERGMAIRAYAAGVPVHAMPGVIVGHEFRAGKPYPYPAPSMPGAQRNTYHALAVTLEPETFLSHVAPRVEECCGKDGISVIDSARFIEDRNDFLQRCRRRSDAEMLEFLNVRMPWQGRTGRVAGAPRCVVYTTIFGGKDELKAPRVVEPGWDYIAFTDDPALKPAGAWKVELVETKQPNPILASKEFRYLPHVYLPEYDESLYIDGSMELTGSIKEMLHSATETDPGLCVFRHPGLRDVQAQLSMAMKCDREPVWRLHAIEALLAERDALGLPPVWTGILYRNHNDPRVLLASQRLWEYCRKDIYYCQAVFMLACRDADVKVGFMRPHYNRWMKYHNHAISSQGQWRGVTEYEGPPNSLENFSPVEPPAQVMIRKWDIDDLVDRLVDGSHLAFARYGDGEWQAILGQQGKNCDGNRYTPELRDALIQTLTEARTEPKYIHGMQRGALRLLRQDINAFHREHALDIKWADADILHYANEGGRLNRFVEFCRLSTPIYVGPGKHEHVDLDLSAFVRTPNVDSYREMDRIVAETVDACGKYPVGVHGSDVPLVLVSMGMSAEVFVYRLWTALSGRAQIIDVGSVFDPYVSAGAMRGYFPRMSRETKEVNMRRACIKEMA